MPSMAIHLAVGNEYVKNFDVDNFSEFRQGIIKPDIVGMKSMAEKQKAHYTDPMPPNATIYQTCFTKVNLHNYLTKNNLKTDFDKGYFLHLITDYYFFGYQLLKKPDLEKIQFKELYPDYEKIAKEIKQKYNVDDSDTPWGNLYRSGEPHLFKKQDIYDLIYVCSQIDLKTIEKQVKDNPTNWREILNNQFEIVLSKKRK